jgi:hypothetical protein
MEPGCTKQPSDCPRDAVKILSKIRRFEQSRTAVRGFPDFLTKAEVAITLRRS